MEKIGIICEYNPFHNGHVYHLEKIKEMYPDSLIVLIMSGYFTQRGEVSLISKYNKTRIALSYGIDLVLELPTLYATNSADIFARASIKALKAAGVEKLVFGSETCDIEMLKQIAKKQIDNESFDERVKEELSHGVNYPTALSKALGIRVESNDILGISYIKAIIEESADITPMPIKRTNDFNDIESMDTIISAKNIREKLKKKLDISTYIPIYPLEYINEIDEEKMFGLLRYKILTDNNLERYLGVDEGLGNKLKKEIIDATDMENLIDKVKSKRYTNLRIRRMLIHLLLGIEKKDIDIEFDRFKILGFSSRGQKYLSTLDKDLFIYKENNRRREIENNSAIIYSHLTKDLSVKEEILNKPIKIEK